MNACLEAYHKDVKNKADDILAKATQEGKQVIILAGRPFRVF